MMITTAKQFLIECRKNKAFKEAVDAIDNQYIVDFAESYAELRLSRVAEQSEQFVCKCGNPSNCTEGNTDNCWDCGKPIKAN